MQVKDWRKDRNLQVLIYSLRRSKRGDVTDGTGHSDSKNLATVSIEASLFSGEACRQGRKAAMDRTAWGSFNLDVNSLIKVLLPYGLHGATAKTPSNTNTNKRLSGTFVSSSQRLFYSILSKRLAAIATPHCICRALESDRGVEGFSRVRAAYPRCIVVTCLLGGCVPPLFKASLHPSSLLIVMKRTGL